MKLITLTTVLLLATSGVVAQSLPSSLPDRWTHGVANPEVTQHNIKRTICRRGWTKTIRPPVQVTESLKESEVRMRRYPDQHLSNYEEDHLIPLELGGDPNSLFNMWAEPRYPTDGWGAAKKDRLEWRLNRLVCTGKLSLKEAQHAIATNWIQAYKKYVR